MFDDARYHEVARVLAIHEGERVRVTFARPHDGREIGSTVGLVRTKDYGHCVDVTLGPCGGQEWGNVTRIEVMQPNGRYVVV